MAAIKMILKKLKSNVFLDTLFFHYLIISAGFIVSILYARILGPEKRGIFEAIFLWRILILNFSFLGMDNATIFYSAKYRNTPEVVFFNASIMRFVFIIFAIAVGYLVILPIVLKNLSYEIEQLGRLVLVLGVLEIFMIPFYMLRGLAKFKMNVA